MIYFAMVLAFFGNLQAPTKEECTEALTEYLMNTGYNSLDLLSSEDLETAKEHLFPTFHFFEEDITLLSTSRQTLNAVSLEDMQKVGNLSSFPNSLYYSLPCTQEDEKSIHKIISTMADKTIFALLFEKRELEKRGKQIDHVHPLRFLGTIFSNHHLRLSMREIKKSSFKWKGFMDGLIPRMKEENNKDNIQRYIPGFAEHVNADPEKIRLFILHQHWESLVRYLMK